MHPAKLLAFIMAPTGLSTLGTEATSCLLAGRRLSGLGESTALAWTQFCPSPPAAWLSQAPFLPSLYKMTYRISCPGGGGNDLRREVPCSEMPVI